MNNKNPLYLNEFRKIIHPEQRLTSRIKDLISRKYNFSTRFQNFAQNGQPLYFRDSPEAKRSAFKAAIKRLKRLKKEDPMVYNSLVNYYEGGVPQRNPYQLKAVLDEISGVDNGRNVDRITKTPGIFGQSQLDYGNLASSVLLKR